MGLVSGTQTKYDINSGREALSDFIYDISPEDTPFLSGAGRYKKGTATLEEWQTDSLAAVDGSNAQLEGDEAAYTTPAATVRVGNYMQISRKTASVSNTTEEINKAGIKSQMAREIARRAAELKRDQETILLQAQAGDAGGVGTARKLAALNAWVKTNDDLGTSGGSPTYTSGVPSAVRTDGTQRAFTETIAKTVIQAVWTSGGSPKVWMLGPVNRSKFSAFGGIATRNFDLSNVSPRATAVIASVDVYVSDYAVIRVIPNRFQRERDGWLLDWEYVKVQYLRPHKTMAMAVTGDAIRRMLICEWTLRVHQEAALGLAADLTTT